MRGALQWIHEVKGHPSPEQWLNSFKKTFDAQVSKKNLKKMVEELYNTCRECLTSKRKHPGDRGLIGALPIPHMVKTLVYVDFIDQPRCETYNYALMIVDAPSLCCQVVPGRKTIDGESVFKAILRHWIHFFQPMVKIYCDRDITFTGEQGWYLNAFRAIGVEVSFGQPYRPQSNRLRQRMNDEYQDTLRSLKTSIKTSNRVQLNDYTMVLMNNKLRRKSGFSRGDLFLSRPTYHLEMPLPHEGHTTVHDWIFHQNKAAQKVQEHLQCGREARVKRVTWKRKLAQYSLGDYVLIHRNRFLSKPVPRGGAKDTLSYGPHLVLGTTGSSIVARYSPTLGGEVPLAHEYLKRYP